MNFVFGPVWTAAPLKVKCSGAPKSLMNCVSVSPIWLPSTFRMGYASLKPHLWEYNCEPTLLHNKRIFTYAVSVANFPFNCLIPNNRLAQYLLLSGKMADRTPRHSQRSVCTKWDDAEAFGYQLRRNLGMSLVTHKSATSGYVNLFINRLNLRQLMEFQWGKGRVNLVQLCFV